MLVLVLLVILSISYFIDNLNNILKASGYFLNRGDLGIVLQSTIGVMNRLSMFLFTPLLGYLADKNILTSLSLYHVLIYCVVVGCLFLFTYISRVRLSIFFSKVIRILQMSGSYYRLLKSLLLKEYSSELELSKEYVGRNENRIQRKVKKFLVTYFLLYIPNYLSWMLIIFLLSKDNSNRGTIIGLSSVLNGATTMGLSVLIDPKLIQITKNINISPYVYLLMLKFRAFSLLTAALLIVMMFFIVR